MDLIPVTAEWGGEVGLAVLLGQTSARSQFWQHWHTAPRAVRNSAWPCKMERGQKADRPHHSTLPQHLFCHLYNAAVSSLVSHSTGKTLINWSKLSGDHQDGQGWRSWAWSSSLFSLENSSPNGFSFVVVVGVFFLLFLKTTDLYHLKETCLCVVKIGCYIGLFISNPPPLLII